MKNDHSTAKISPVSGFRLSRFFAIILCAVTVFAASFALLPSVVYADTGPKPSVHVKFKGLGDGLCYATLLSRNKSTGPSSAWNGNEESARHNENERYPYELLGYDDWKAFVEYKDPDGFYFLQEAWQVNDSRELAWTYYPPDEFKVLIYFPESGKFAVSEICERYAFDSYFTVSMENVDIGSIEYDEILSSDARLKAYRSYNYGMEIFSLFVRILITIIIEMAIALLFRYTAKKQLILLAAVNLVTQVILNVLLNLINYNSGQTMFVVFYILLELIVFAIEAVVYYHYLNYFASDYDYKADNRRVNRRAVLYAFVANAASFIIGLLIANLIPGIF